MKKLLPLLALIAFSFAGCNTLKLMVDNDYSYDTDFTVYKNYNFLACEVDTSFICTEIQDAIRRQMRARGYKLTDDAPGLLVSYSIIKERVEYKGYFQPTLNRWVNKYDYDDTYKTQNFNFGGGMILVSLLDAESSKLIWRGYASGVFNKSIKKPVNYYRSVVRTIFDQYPLFAAGETPRKLTSLY
ncbi:DUF4136 domain-containing protein [Arcticibacterium luteifluviistationis]|uniref:DUF4136 domain-containing protein n=1 Tax=Arcticibacterium luteifluviistationis TaxID=1784714 RepID=A0A2Z4GHU8_9BACT|nr:DUF4136 domain-containing protein [Arcticibacterium luteifluviistationis]AWW00940.1 DUF4136 domain-containing protein [Arcticibacterium luteifluviistationis]